MKIDMPRLKQDLRKVAEDLQQLKRRMRTSRYVPTWQEWLELSRSKHSATRLCSFRAHLRGKVHSPVVDPKDLEAWIGSCSEIYALQPEKHSTPS